jgi:hypothetical protein
MWKWLILFSRIVGQCLCFVFVGLDVPSAGLCAMSASDVVDPVSVEKKVNTELYGVLLEECIFLLFKKWLWSVWFLFSIKRNTVAHC